MCKPRREQTLTRNKLQPKWLQVTEGLQEAMLSVLKKMEEILTTEDLWRGKAVKE